MRPSRDTWFRCSKVSALPIKIYPRKLTPATSPPSDTTHSHEMHIKIKHISKLYIYTDDKVRFPVRSQSVNQYIMIAYHYDSNSAIASTFKSRTNKHRILAYGATVQHIKDRNILVDLQILDNKESTKYKRIINPWWGVKCQLLPPRIHQITAADRAIRTFKTHCLSIISGISKTFPKNLWYLLIPQTDLTLNLLWKWTLNPRISAC